MGWSVNPGACAIIQDEATIIKRYLLGQLPETEEDQVDLRLLNDADYAEEFDIIVSEMTDQYARGEIQPEERESFEQYFFKSPDRQAKLRFALALKQRRSELVFERLRRKKLLTFYLPIAACLIVAVGLGIGIWRVYYSTSDVDRGLVALQNAYRQERPNEARISQLDYAPYLTTRGPGTDKVDQDELRRAELTLLEALKKNPTPDVRHGLGRVHLAKKDFDKAIEQFDEALKGDPKNAQLYSDLGAAWLEKGKIDLARGKANPTGSELGKAMEDFARSLENLKHARELSPNQLEALFNSALVHEEMALPPEAEEDWKRYLEKDSNSRWAEEARRHLNDIQEGKKTRSQNKVGLLPEFVKASESRNDDRAYELLSTNTEAIAGQLMWWQLAEALLDSSSRRESDSADRYQQALTYAGNLQEERSGDSFLSELAAFYGATSSQQMAELAKAHSMINEAHKLLAKSKVAEALKLYEKAKAVFDNAGDRGEGLFALYWIGYSYYRESQFTKAESILTQLADRSKAGSYLWLLEKALTMIANIQVESSRFSESIASYTQSLNISQKINDVYNAQKNLSSLANSYKNLGKREESLNYIARCLKSSQAHWTGGRQMYRNYYTTAGVLNSFGYHHAAAEYEKAALQLAIEEADPVLQNQSYIALAAIYSRLRDFPEALKYANLSYQAAKRMDERTSLRPTADAFLHLGHVNRQIGDHPKALSYYDKAIKSYADMKHFALLYEAHKGRLLDYIAQNKDLETKEELQIVLGLFEEHRWKIREERNRNSFFDLQQSVYDLAINFEYSRTRDSQKAFEYSEVSRARSLLDLINANAKATGKDDPDLVISSVRQPLDLKGIKEQMPEQAQILQYTVLDDKIVAWVISKTRFETAEQRIDASSFTEKVIRYSQSLSASPDSDPEELRREGMELYEILIKPVELLLEKDKQIYVVPDKALNSLAFNALISPATGRYLVNDYLLAFAPSSNVFIVCTELASQRSERPDERLLSVGDPYFNKEAFPELPALPESGKEAKQIADYYKSGSLLLGERATKEKVSAEMDRADVIHLASHYVVNDQNPMLSQLLLTRDATKPGTETEADGSLQAYEICERKLPVTRLVTLSACRTGVERYYSGEGMIGMSRTFIAAGVPTVVASLWPVSSDPTADLMISLHKFRKQNHLSTALALRQSQLDMIASQKSQPYYWASFVLIGGYANF
jgi:CHAT domain-containing protein/tetratricopeptide (TPR) repeat protein